MLNVFIHMYLFNPKPVRRYEQASVRLKVQVKISIISNFDPTVGNVSRLDLPDQDLESKYGQRDLKYGFRHSSQFPMIDSCPVLDVSLDFVPCPPIH
jgi:hypothetical protein